MLLIKHPQVGKNITVQVTGVLDEELGLTAILDVRKLAHPAEGVRLDGVIWLIQEKMGINLWWGEGELLLPLESRGATRFDYGLHNKIVDGWDGKVWMTTFNAELGILPKHFHFTLDFDRL